MPQLEETTLVSIYATLAEFGIKNNPNNWKLYYGLGFIYYTELQDYAKAGEAFSRGTQVPGAHPFLRILAARMAQNAGDFETATSSPLVP